MKQHIHSATDFNGNLSTFKAYFSALPDVNSMHLLHGKNETCQTVCSFSMPGLRAQHHEVIVNGEFAYCQ